MILAGLVRALTTLGSWRGSETSDAGGGGGEGSLPDDDDDDDDD